MVNKQTAKALLEWPDFKDYATEVQIKHVTAMAGCRTVAGAASKIGVTRTTLYSSLRHVLKKAARAGWAPLHDVKHPVPPGFAVKGVSSYYGEDGTLRGQWIKTREDQAAREELFKEALAELRTDYTGLYKPVSQPTEINKDLLAVFPIGDPHLGLYCWRKECGQDWSLALARETLVSAIYYLVERAPAAETALILNLGDFFHADNPTNRTTRSGANLDVDTRWAKVLRTGIGVMKTIVRAALEKHKRVIVVNEIGNHDDNTAVMLSAVLAEAYHNEPRVIVDDAPRPFHYYRFGKNLIGSTHGHRIKPADLPSIMAVDRKEDWGETSFRTWYTGHVHHNQVKDYRGCTVESVRTLAPGDAWHHAEGYRSSRSLSCHVWHKEWGRVESHHVGIERFVGR